MSLEILPSLNTTAPDQPRWRRRPDDRPSEILGAALEIFIEKGLAGARVEDIAARAGVSKGTIYLYFRGKEQLFRETIREHVQSTVEGLASATPPGEPVGRLRSFIEALWRHLRRPAFSGLYRLLMAELHQFPELTRFYAEEVSGRVIALSAEIIRDGVESGHLRDVDPVVASRMIVGVLVQHAVWTSRRELFPHLGDRTDEEILDDMKDFLLAGLLYPASPSMAGTDR